ncbi:TPA: hypothetical protein P2Q98_002962 [Aeromonas veronii]|uniref:hypothetical protein n=1 Tax=Aeromonas veronii TaxID=654 RepID=UPI00330F9DB2|nr:hypothetical protein [Aeromonas veronii]HDO1334753.1 hypothetical protein [Aeromonas veronii]HDO1337138.1 hypothetical protein [Aeromonas veronii]HDO1342363.1 hypothetical protein [Aeromonas veronii]HDO1346702.1 hypothetical protein [Aeromonas veronii]
MKKQQLFIAILGAIGLAGPVSAATLASQTFSWLNMVVGELKSAPSSLSDIVRCVMRRTPYSRVINEASPMAHGRATGPC